MTRDAVARAALAFAAAILVAAAAIHGMAYRAAAATLDASALPPRLVQGCKALWLGNSTALATLAILYAVGARRPATLTRATIFISAMLPFFAGAVLYAQFGPFVAGHLMMTATLALAVAGWRWRAEPRRA